MTELIEESGRIAGVRATIATGRLEVRVDLVVGADGHHPVIRERAGLSVEDVGAPMDVLWFRPPHRPADPTAGDYWQLGYVIPKGSARLVGIGIRPEHVEIAAGPP